MTRKTFRNATASITIIKPRGKKGSFKLRLETVDFDGLKKTDSKKLASNPKLKKVNQMFLDGLIDIDEATTLLKDLKQNILKDYKPKEEKQDIHRSNNQLLNSYLEKVYYQKAEEGDFKEVTIDGAKSDFKRVIQAFGAVSLVTGDRLDIINKWKKFKVKPKSKLKLSSKANALLGFANREFKVGLTKREKAGLNDIEDKTWITEKDLKILIPTISRPEDQLATKVLFYSGMRIGELYGIEDNEIEEFGDHAKLQVNSAMTREGILDLPKAYKKRKLFIPQDAKEELYNWSELDSGYFETDMYLFGPRLKSACRRLWPDQEIKHCSPHGLRRSFARYMRSKGYAIGQIADLMGDGEEVVRKDYLGLSRDEKFWDNITDNY